MWPARRTHGALPQRGIGAVGDSRVYTVLRVGKDDWYRGPIWDLATREHFEQKLSRARTQRAQYLRIKGYELTRADDRSVWAAGRGLLQRVLDEHPDDGIWVIDAHHHLGWSFAREGAYTEAAYHYEASLALQRQRGGSVDPGTRLTLAELVVDAGWEHRYQEAVDLLGDFISSRPAGLFPIEHFRVLLVEARIAERLGRGDIARRDAERALELLASNESVLPRHPGVGVIRTGEETVRELERLATLD
jgi:tetratricopeptide (TPR) repeat protein